MSSYAYVNYEDVKHLAHVVSINDVVYTTELMFAAGEHSISGDLNIIEDKERASISAEVCFPFNRDRELRTRLVDWLFINGIMFRVVH